MVGRISEVASQTRLCLCQHRQLDINKGRGQRKSDIIKHNQLRSISLFNQEATTSHTPGDGGIAQPRGLTPAPSPMKGAAHLPVLDGGGGRQGEVSTCAEVKMAWGTGTSVRHAQKETRL